MSVIVIFFLKTLSYAVNLLPQPVFFFCGRLLGLFWFHVVRFRRHVVIQNLQNAFGTEKTADEVYELAKKHFQHIGCNILETIRCLTWTLENYSKHVSVHGIEHVKNALSSGKGAILLFSHLGNWEYLLGTTRSCGIELDALAKKARNPFSDKILQWHRNRTGAGFLAESGSVNAIFRSLNQNRVVVFVQDQFMGPPIGLPVKFFGIEAGSAVGLALITEKRPVPIIPTYCYRDNNGRLHFVYEDELVLPALSEDKDERLYQKTQFYNDIMEKQIRQHPEQWLWLHRRWKKYNGEPRWKMKNILTLSAFTLLLLTCSTAPKTATKTGIEIPPDPQVAVPTYDANATEESDEDYLTEETTAATATPAAAAPQATTAAVPPATAAPAATTPPAPGAKAEEKPKADATATATPKVEPVVAAAAAPKEAPKKIVKKKKDSLSFPIFAPERIPFNVGEKMEIDLVWMNLPAGKVFLEVREGGIFNGRPTFVLWANALSSKLVDAIYHIDNTIETTVDKQGLVPYKFLLHMFETHQKKETRVSFDHTKNKAYYWAKRISEKWGNENPDRVDNIMPQARDMFSAIYYARALNYQLGKHQKVSVYENNQNVQVDLVPVANELVNTKVGYFQCWKIKVTVTINNVLKPMGDLYMWLSDDSKKYLVKFDAKIKVGAVIGSLSGLSK